MVWRCSTCQACLLSPGWEQQLSSGSASAHVPGLVGTSTRGHDPDPEYISVLHSVLSSRPGIWGLSDPSMDRLCGQGGRMLQSQRTGLVLAPRRGPCPQDSPACRRQKTTQPRRQGLMARPGWLEGPLVCVWMREERGSPGSPSEMSLFLPGPGANLSHVGHAPFPRGSNQK